MKNTEIWSEATQLTERSDSIYGAKRLYSGGAGGGAPRSITLEMSSIRNEYSVSFEG